ncbi:MAG: 50S ribosomal protein L21 [candidate division KSB1 bacterium]|nr:50S ribosomal protein L21 [candidate division KSB1 bacterium]MDZ7334901.1 50S ribosomal protein L21 [candidate division KSB1 bacterium]MDZ7358725.1 50S ribosomal protein L21 [candidate division KSB1 bacterium]MDZ7376786.1 50S ribosomal protein L21 [candidate division KSB1 bacterium]MDZ7399357.1 50S ribosomal protein L21 [candidate division KSB1 bacterium]
MYAIVEVGGQQFKVAKNDVILAPKIEGQQGETVALDRVMLIADDNGIKVGNPVVAGAQVKASIVDFTRGKKVIIFKKKRREGYKVKKGHRQDYTRLKIEDIVMG